MNSYMHKTTVHLKLGAITVFNDANLFTQSTSIDDCAKDGGEEFLNITYCVFNS